MWNCFALCIFLAASNDDGKFLLAARKCRRPTCTDYIISLNGDDVSKGSSTYIGKLRYCQLDYDLTDILLILEIYTYLNFLNRSIKLLGDQIHNL